MKGKYKQKNTHRPPVGPTRGKYRQMWKRQMWDMVPGEEEVTPDERGDVSAQGAGEYRGSIAA